MTKDEFLETTIKFSTLYNKKLNEVQLGFWFDELKTYDIDKYKRVIGEFVRTQRLFPSLSEVLNKIRNIQEPTTVANPTPVKKVECSKCHGSGLVKYYQRFNDVDYEYLCKCFCENGKRLDLPLREYEDVFFYRTPEFNTEAIDYDISQINF